MSSFPDPQNFHPVGFFNFVEMPSFFTVCCFLKLLHVLMEMKMKKYVCVYIQGVTGGKDQTSGECSLGQTIPI